MRLIRVLTGTGFAEQAGRLLAAPGEPPATPAARAARAQAEALVRLAAGDSAAAEAGLRDVLAHNPYTTDARLDLVRLLAALARPAEARALIDEAGPAQTLGPDFRRRAEAAIR